MLKETQVGTQTINVHGGTGRTPPLQTENKSLDKVGHDYIFGGNKKWNNDQKKKPTI